ncbi:hypothetical protein [Candidatus Lokiarchaeum ossiferum]|uniref:hypothetical protein n=1 Tax=Candidatus Lokiarchaeum ossiferum TaxID=2951803 RepID=UPI00352FE53A
MALQNPFIIKIIVNNAEILSFFSKIAYYYSQKKILHEDLKIEFEPFEKGVLLIYENFEYFHRITQSLTKEQEKMKEKVSDQKPPFDLTDFPDRGFSFEFHFDQKYAELTQKLVFGYLNYVHPEMGVVVKSQTQLLITCPHIEAFQALLQDFFYRYSIID